MEKQWARPNAGTLLGIDNRAFEKRFILSTAHGIV